MYFAWIILGPFALVFGFLFKVLCVVLALVLYNSVDKRWKYGPAQMLESIYSNELAYLRQAIIEVIPDGRNALKYM